MNDPALQHVSLELLALQSPHGSRQQWEEEEPRELESMWDAAGQRPGDKPQRPVVAISDLTSPSNHMAPFQPSPIHSAYGDEYDLASPIALPDSPPSVVPWKKALALECEEEPSEAEERGCAFEQIGRTEHSAVNLCSENISPTVPEVPSHSIVYSVQDFSAA
ncbi:hypothetical protein PINS_up015151 [Pythium insidiosum]|nr:hypothetical protein PINS_up015151 [Pythium insidiosum]